MRIVFFGTPEFAVPSLAALATARDASGSLLKPVAVVTQPPQAVGRHATLTPSPIAKLARTLKIPLAEPESIKSPDFVEWLRGQKPDVAVLVAYGKILPESVLSIPRLGFVNVHPSLLPAYRGASPVAGALLAGESQTGVTIMQLDKEMDHGPILVQQKVAIPAGATTGSLSTTLAELGASMLTKILPDFVSGRVQPTQQDHARATFTKLLKRSDGEIDWPKSAQHIERLVRAYSPWPGTFTCLGDKRLKILQASIARDTNSRTTSETITKPGAILIDRDQLLIQAGGGLLRVERLQLAGKKAQTAAEFIRGHAGLTKATVGPCPPSQRDS